MNITDFSMDYFSVKGKNAVVTGGNTGLGQAFSLALAKGGANILIPSLMDDGGETKEIIEREAKGVQVETMQADLTQDFAAERVVKTCVDRFGSIDILINSAGLCINKPVENFDRKSWDKMVDVNLTVPFDMIHEATKYMIPQNSGKIVNVCSLFSYLGGQWSPAYAATKHGLAGLTKAYCDELAQYNIQVNGIAPGYFATELTKKTRTSPEKNSQVIKHVPAAKWGDTVDLMGSILFLASRASDFVNGHILVVDGGYLVR